MNAEISAKSLDGLHGEYPKKMILEKAIYEKIGRWDPGTRRRGEDHPFRGNALPLRMPQKLGRVDHQDAFLDTDTLERERGITIFSKQAILPLGEWEITLLDTPGHVDFSSEMERTLQVLDYAILVISGTDGVQGHTLTLWHLLKRYRIPTFLFVNKMDLPGADRATLLGELQARLDGGCVDFSAESGADFWKALLCAMRIRSTVT